MHLAAVEFFVGSAFDQQWFGDFGNLVQNGESNSDFPHRS